MEEWALTQLPEQHKSPRQMFKLNKQRTARNLVVNLDRKHQVLKSKLASALSKEGSLLRSRATLMPIHVVDPETGDANAFIESYNISDITLFKDNWAEPAESLSDRKCFDRGFAN